MSPSSIGDSNNGPNKHRTIRHLRAPTNIHDPNGGRPGGTWLLSPSSIEDNSNGSDKHRPIYHRRAATYIHDRHRPCGTLPSSIPTGIGNIHGYRPITPIVKRLKRRIMLTKLDI